MMTYLFLGEDTLAKDQKITELKKKILPTPQAAQFDYESLSASKLDPEDLKKSLISLPAIASKRLIIIRDCHRLSAHNQELIVEFLEKSFQHAVLVLDSGEWDQKNSFLKKIRRMVELVEFSSSPKLNVFDLTKAIDLKKEVEALKILDQLTSGGTHPLQVLGGIVWFWGQTRSRLSAKQFEGGLLALQEADLNIKRSRLKPEYAVELLVVKLCSLN